VRVTSCMLRKCEGMKCRTESEKMWVGAVESESAIWRCRSCQNCSRTVSTPGLCHVGPECDYRREDHYADHFPRFYFLVKVAVPLNRRNSFLLLPNLSFTIISVTYEAAICKLAFIYINSHPSCVEVKNGGAIPPLRHRSTCHSA
jgi:hypothetical protein